MLERKKERYVPPYNLALVFAGLGEPEAALHWRGQALEERDVPYALSVGSQVGRNAIERRVSETLVTRGIRQVVEECLVSKLEVLLRSVWSTKPTLPSKRPPRRCGGDG